MHICEAVCHAMKMSRLCQIKPTDRTSHKLIGSVHFDCIPLLGLNITVEFALSDSSKTVSWVSYKLRVESWLSEMSSQLFFLL